MTDSKDETERLRAEEWVFHFVNGNVKQAADIEASGPAMRPSAVVAAVMALLADDRLMLVPMRDDSTEDLKEEELDADHSEG